MKIHLIFATPDPSPEMIIDAVAKSLDNLTFSYKINPKEWDVQSDNGTHPVELLELLRNTDLGMVLHSTNTEQYFKIHYIRNSKNISKIYDMLIFEDISTLVYINRDHGFMTAITYFEELYSDDEIKKKEIRLKEIIHQSF